MTGLVPRLAVGAQLLGLDVTERLVAMLEDQGGAHKIHAVARGLDRRCIGPRTVPDPGAQAGRIWEDRQGRTRVELGRVLLVQGRSLGD